MLNKLRKETAQLHQEIEKSNLAGKIIDHSISREEYKLLLLQNYICYKVVEKEISRNLPQFSSNKAERLYADLSTLEVDSHVYKEFENDFFIASNAEALGAQYVLEGSVMGGMLISMEIEKCDALIGISEPQFFNGDRRSMEGWKLFLNSIKNLHFTEAEEMQAINKAKDTFIFFGKVFNAINLQTAKV